MATARVVLSSGGVAGGVISEGQGYGLLLAAAMAAAMEPTDERRPAAIARAHAAFLGWRALCLRTSARRRLQASCQQDARVACGSGAVCLPSWKFNSNVSAEVGTGSAPDGDQDAILGMVLLLHAAESRTPRPPWTDALRSWTYSSAAAFLHYETQPHPTLRASNGEALRITKLGSCWGGWACVNPSYLAPAHYRVFRDFMRAHESRTPPPESSTPPPDGTASTREWDALIEGSYRVLLDAQCASTGLVTNWSVQP